MGVNWGRRCREGGSGGGEAKIELRSAIPHALDARREAVCGTTPVTTSLLHALYNPIGGIRNRMDGQGSTAHEVSSRGARGIVDGITDLAGNVAIVA